MVFAVATIDLQHVVDSSAKTLVLVIIASDNPAAQCSLEKRLTLPARKEFAHVISAPEPAQQIVCSSCSN